VTVCSNHGHWHLSRISVSALLWPLVGSVAERPYVAGGKELSPPIPGLDSEGGILRGPPPTTGPTSTGLHVRQTYPLFFFLRGSTGRNSGPAYPGAGPQLHCQADMCRFRAVRRRTAAADILLTPPPPIVTDRRATAAAANRMSASRRRRFRDVFMSCCTPAICC